MTSENESIAQVTELQRALAGNVFDRVLGVDIPDLFPVEQRPLLRHIYLEVARQTRTAQPVVGRYLHYLTDAMLIREFRRYPLAKSRTARVPVKITLTDLGVRNALFRRAPSLWESAPDVVGPLVETLAQSALRGPGLQVHFFRDYVVPGDRRSPVEEVDFVVELLDGTAVPLEVKFRKNVSRDDVATVRRFATRFKSPWGLVVTRDHWNPGGEDDPTCVRSWTSCWRSDVATRRRGRCVTSGSPTSRRRATTR